MQIVLLLVLGIVCTGSYKINNLIPTTNLSLSQTLQLCLVLLAHLLYLCVPTLTLRWISVTRRTIAICRSSRYSRVSRDLPLFRLGSSCWDIPFATTFRQWCTSNQVLLSIWQCWTSNCADMYLLFAIGTLHAKHELPLLHPIQLLELLFI
jgi:hypothetical protein